MKKVKYFAWALLLAGGFAMTSCSDDDVATTQVNMELNVINSIGDDLTVKTGTHTRLPTSAPDLKPRLIIPLPRLVQQLKAYWPH